MKKPQVDENGDKYILNRTDVCFSEYLLPAVLMKKIILTETLFLRREDKKHQKKKLGCKFIRINISKEGYHADYEASRIQTFISKFKDKQLKKLNKKVNKLEDKIEKLTSRITQ